MSGIIFKNESCTANNTTLTFDISDIFDFWDFNISKITKVKNTDYIVLYDLFQELYRPVKQTICKKDEKSFIYKHKNYNLGKLRNFYQENWILTYIDPNDERSHKALVFFWY